MSRLGDKIRRAQEALADAQDRLEALEHKRERASRKRRRKRHRKLMRDPGYRATHEMMRRAERLLLENQTPVGTEVFRGLSSQIQETRD